MKVVFLDIDGVCNSHIYFVKLKERIAQGEAAESSTEQYASAMLDPDAIYELNRILRVTGAVVVISSSWRHGHPMTNISRMLRYRGFEGHIIGATPELPHGVLTPAFQKFLDENPGHIDGTRNCRGNEIQAWLDVVPAVTKFVILDDSHDFGHLFSFHVHTPLLRGLLPEHADRAIEILNTEAV